MDLRAWIPIACFAAALYARPAYAGCECGARVETAGFTFEHLQTCSDGHAAIGRSQARGVLVGINLWRSVSESPILTAAAGAAGLHLVRQGEGRIGDATWKPHALTAEARVAMAALLDSVAADTTVYLHTVRLGTFRDPLDADTLVWRLEPLWAKDHDEPGRRDTTLALDWSYRSCETVRRPGLFVRPDVGDGFTRVTYGLYADLNDAKAALERVAGRTGVRGRVVTMRATPAIVAAAIRQASFRPAEWSVPGPR